MGNKKGYLLLHTCDPMLWKTVETCLRTRYPEAEIRKGKKNEDFVVKRFSNERLKIRITANREENTTRFTFSYLHWGVRGIRYGMMGVWPTLIFDNDSYGLREDVAESLGNYLGMRYWKKTEYYQRIGFWKHTRQYFLRKDKSVPVPSYEVKTLFKP